MQQQSLELRRPHTALVLTGETNTSPDNDSAEALVRLWDEAERAVVAKIALETVPRRVEPAEQPQRVRYTYD
jgi:hypothetical protein